MTSSYAFARSAVDLMLTMLREEIRARGFTQLQVQSLLGWGRTYITQLFRKQKALRLEQVLLILDAIGAEPAGFFDEFFFRSNRRRAGGGDLPAEPEGAP